MSKTIKKTTNVQQIFKVDGPPKTTC